MFHKIETNGELCEIVCEITGYEITNVSLLDQRVKILTKEQGYIEVETPPQHPEFVEAFTNNNVLTILLKIDPETNNQTQSPPVERA